MSSSTLLDEALAASTDANCDFTIDNLPIGIGTIRYDHQDEETTPTTIPPSSFVSRPRCLTAIGDSVLDLSRLQEAGLFDDMDELDSTVFQQDTLNKYMEHPSDIWLQVRQRLQAILCSNNGNNNENDDDNDNDNDNDRYHQFLRSDPMLQRATIHKLSNVRMQLPARIGDYTDFYSSREHATNVGTMFRGADKALQPNWLHLPVGYHGRSSTVICSDEHPYIVRPSGQIQSDPTDPTKGSVYGPCAKLDFELEVAFFVGGPSNRLGWSLTMEEAKRRIFGFVLMNDWSARDIQKWEYVPLGPFTSKNFATTISPWIVSIHALDNKFTAPTSAVEQKDPMPLQYLHDPDYSSYDIHLSVSIQPHAEDSNATSSSNSENNDYVVCRSNFRNLYWNAAQQLVHHSVTGCIMNPGDLLASGTISGTTDDSFGSMLELSWNGTRDVHLGNSQQTRKFLHNGDTVTITGYCTKQGHNHRVGFGMCRGTILPPGTCPPNSKRADADVSRYEDIKLYGRWKSSSSWRVRIALAAKNVPYKLISIDFQTGENKKEWFLQKNPLGQIPVLEYTDSVSGQTTCISQSVAIIEFLDHAYSMKSRPIVPIDPSERIIAIELLEIINSGTQPMQNLAFIASIKEMSKNELEVDQFRQDVIRKGLAVVEHHISRLKTNKDRLHTHCGPYAMGGFCPNVVDIYLVPQLENARTAGINVKDEFPTLCSVDEACKDHPWFTKAHPSVQPDAPTK